MKHILQTILTTPTAETIDILHIWVFWTLRIMELLTVLWNAKVSCGEIPGAEVTDNQHHLAWRNFG